MSMKSKDNHPTNNGVYSIGLNARRSYNLLRPSLAHPLTLPHTAIDICVSMSTFVCETQPNQLGVDT